VTYCDPRTGWSSENWLICRLLEDAVRAWAPRARGVLLDVGCGYRPYEPHFRPHVDHYVGLEFPITGGSRRGDVHGSGLALPFADASFDTVVSFQVLEHVPDPQRMIDECVRVLRPGGQLLVTANFLWGLHEEPHDYFRFSKYGFELLLARAGAGEVSVSPMAGAWVTTGQRIAYALHRHIGAWPAVVRVPPLFLVQWCGARLDRIDRWDADAWNYLATATKPPANPARPTLASISRP
jgi:SAM-dependent methyltransferase